MNAPTAAFQKKADEGERQQATGEKTTPNCWPILSRFARERAIFTVAVTTQWQR